MADRKNEIEEAVSSAFAARKDRLSLLRQARGMWRDRDDLPDLMRQLREEREEVDRRT